jgi:hypothetical protein
MTAKQDVVAKYKSGKLPTIRVGFMYTEAGRRSANPLPVTSCIQNTFRKWTGFILPTRSRT